MTSSSHRFIIILFSNKKRSQTQDDYYQVYLWTEMDSGGCPRSVFLSLYKPARVVFYSIWGRELKIGPRVLTKSLQIVRFETLGPISISKLRVSISKDLLGISLCKCWGELAIVCDTLQPLSLFILILLKAIYFLWFDAVLRCWNYAHNTNC